MIVTCVLWSGNFRTRTYDKKWVVNLERMCRKHIPFSFEFVCFTNIPDFRACKTIPINNDAPGWWAKMNSFKFSNFKKGEVVLYIDLDTLILKDLTNLINKGRDSDLMLLPALSSSTKNGAIPRYNTSVILFKAGSPVCRDLYLDFFADRHRHMSWYRGDQDFIGDCVPDLPTFPKNWFTKIKNIHNEKDIPKSTKILLMNPIKNDVASKKFEWVDKIWNG